MTNPDIAPPVMRDFPFGLGKNLHILGKLDACFGEGRFNASTAPLAACGW